MKNTKTISTLGWTGSIGLMAFAGVVMASSYNDLHPAISLTLQASPAQISYEVVVPAENDGNDTLFKLLYSIESRNGLRRYRPSNKDKDCSIKHKEACGYHQITSLALEQIGCVTNQCYLDRDNEAKSEVMARKYLAWLAKHYDNHSLVFQYLAYNQGGHGTSTIYKVAQGIKKKLPRAIRRNMRKNFPSGKPSNKLSHELQAQVFISQWTIKVEQLLKEL